MEVYDLKTLSSMSRGLWSDLDESKKMSDLTVTATSLLDLNDQKTMDRAVLTLLGHAKTQGPMASAKLFDAPFFRLSPEDRLILVALHLSKWSYARLGHLLQLPERIIAQRAWKSRIRLAFAPKKRKSPAPIVFPTGSPIRGLTCPDYDVQNPWTQRFLDEELGPEEKIFIQKHVLKCRTCQTALSRTRELYYYVRTMIPGFEDEADWDLEVRRLQGSIDRVHKHLEPWRNSFIGSLRIFSKRRDIQLALALLVLLYLFT